MNVEDIERGLKRPGKSKRGLAAALGRQPSAVTALLKGERELKAREIPVIRAYLEANDEHISSESIAADHLVEPAPARTVRLKGYVGAGSQAHFYAVSDGDLEPVEATHGATDQTVAVEIKGKSFGPLMDSWLVYYDDVRSPITDDLIGQICVVGLADDRILIKKLVRDGKGGFDLLSNTDEPPIKNAQIEWAARVTDMKPRR